MIRTGNKFEILNDTISLFSRAAELAKQYSGALTYALRKSREIPIDDHSWSTFQALVWSAVSSEPTTMAVALDLLAVKRDDVGLPVDSAGAGEALEALLLRNAPLRNASEVAWALWAAIQLEVDLSSDVAREVSAVEDDFVALLALDANERGRFPSGSLDKTAWEQLIDHDLVLSSDHWLLAYEGTIKGWMASAVTRVQQDTFFSDLEGRGVHFYDRTPTRNPFTGPAGPLSGGDYKGENADEEEDEGADEEEETEDS